MLLKHYIMCSIDTQFSQKELARQWITDAMIATFNPYVYIYYDRITTMEFHEIVIWLYEIVLRL